MSAQPITIGGFLYDSLTFYEAVVSPAVGAPTQADILSERAVPFDGVAGLTSEARRIDGEYVDGVYFAHFLDEHVDGAILARLRFDADGCAVEAWATIPWKPWEFRACVTNDRVFVVYQGAILDLGHLSSNNGGQLEVEQNLAPDGIVNFNEYPVGLFGAPFLVSSGEGTIFRAVSNGEIHQRGWVSWRTAKNFSPYHYWVGFDGWEILNPVTGAYIKWLPKEAYCNGPHVYFFNTEGETLVATRHKLEFETAAPPLEDVFYEPELPPKESEFDTGLPVDVLDQYVTLIPVPGDQAPFIFSNINTGVVATIEEGGCAQYHLPWSDEFPLDWHYVSVFLGGSGGKKSKLFWTNFKHTKEIP